MKKQKTLTMEVYEKIKNGDKLQAYEINAINTPNFPTVEREDYKGVNQFDTAQFKAFLLKVDVATKKKANNQPTNIDLVCFKGSRFYTQCCDLLNSLVNGQDLPKADGTFERGTALLLDGNTSPVTFDKDSKQLRDVVVLLKRVIKNSVEVKVTESNLAESESYEANKFNREFNER